MTHRDVMKGANLFTPIQRMKLINITDNILKSTPNLDRSYLEMAFVFDASLDGEYLKEMTSDIIKALKNHNDIYKNVRTNTLLWYSDDELIKEVTPMPILQMGTYFDKIHNKSGKKTWDFITAQLKLFYARSKIIILIGKDNYDCINEKQVMDNLSPFLKRKLLIVTDDEIKKYGM